MASFNKVMLIGNLTRDPELRVTPKGTSIAQFGLAVNRQFKDESGASRDETTFIDIEAWGKQGELVAKYLFRGSLCFVEGRLRFDQWEDKQSGQKRSKLKVVVENVQFLGSPTGQGGENSTNSRQGDGQGVENPANEAGTPRNSAPHSRGNSRPPAVAQERVDDDVPF